MKLTIFFISLFALFSCTQSAESNRVVQKVPDDFTDTTIVKTKNVLESRYDSTTYSKSNIYYWIVNSDTLDFELYATEYLEDSALHLYVSHKKAMLFADLLHNLNNALPILKDDFNLNKITSIFIKSPIYYLDVTTKLSEEYALAFGRKNIGYEKLNQFLLTSAFNKTVNDFLNPLNLKVESYGIEKFHLMEKKHFGSYLPGTDLTNYPEFSIAGMGVYVSVENK